MEFIETSAKKDTQVNEAFMNITTGMIKDVNKKSIVTNNAPGNIRSFIYYREE